MGQLLILQAEGKRGQTQPEVVYTDGKMLPASEAVEMEIARDWEWVQLPEFLS